jgi:branched-subunit amino acid transport protein AzlD
VQLHQILPFWIFLMLRHYNKPMQCNITNLLNIFSYINVNASFSSARIHLLITAFLPEQTEIRQIISSTHESN